jgi:hypothetical protein
MAARSEVMTNADATLIIAIVALITAVGCDPEHIEKVIEEVGVRGLGATPVELVENIREAIFIVERRHQNASVAF